MSEIKLNELRELIDGIDLQIVELYKRRIDICKDIADYKLNNKIPIYDAGREEQKLKNLSDTETDKVYKNAILNLYKHIMEYSKELQSEYTRAYKK